MLSRCVLGLLIALPAPLAPAGAQIVAAPLNATPVFPPNATVASVNQHFDQLQANVELMYNKLIAEARGAADRLRATLTDLRATQAALAQSIPQLRAAIGAARLQSAKTPPKSPVGSDKNVETERQLLSDSVAAMNRAIALALARMDSIPAKLVAAQRALDNLSKEIEALQASKQKDLQAIAASRQKAVAQLLKTEAQKSRVVAPTGKAKIVVPA